MKTILEICCGSFEDVKTAYENGADRVELNSALYLGGLTPSLANLICAKEQCSIPIITMVRPRGADSVFQEDIRQYFWIQNSCCNMVLMELHLAF